ncbi:MAG: T9SS type A sorting domain-containing protein [Bacteroidales bacterium]|jgi:hypothetical protein
MKKKYLLISFSLAAMMTVGQNLIKNGSFEGEYVENMPAEWVQFGVDGGQKNNNGAGPAAVGDNEPAAQDGEKYHRFTNVSANQWANIAQIVEVQASSHYKLTFYARYFGNAINTKLDVIIGGYSSEQNAKNGRIANIVAPALVVDGKVPDIQVPAPYSAVGPAVYVDAATSRDQNWIQHTCYMTANDTVQWLRFNMRKNGAQWYVDNVVLEKVDEIPASSLRLLEASDKFILENSIVVSSVKILAETKGTVMLLDMSGRKIIAATLSEGYNHVMVGNIPNGLYLAKLTDNDGKIKTFRIIKK